MKKSLRISVLLAVMLTAMGDVGAAGLGRLSIMSALGQPLKAEIELLSVQSEELSGLEAKLAPAEAFRQARMERVDALSNIQFSIGQKASGQPVLRITSNSLINDPYLDLLIELNWNSGRILREYTVLLDPPTPVRTPADSGRTPGAVQAQVDMMPPVQGTALKPLDVPTMPAKSVKQPAQADERKKTYGPVKAGDTLRGIAAKVIHRDVTLEMMVASLYQANQKAFSRDNMNLLRKGQTLVVPDRDAVMRMFSPSQARSLMRDHGKAWSEYRSQLAATSAKLPGADATVKAPAASSGKIVPAPAQPAVVPSAESKDVLKLSKGQPAPSGNPVNKAQLQAAEEELAAKNRALKEANERVVQLERTVQDMQKLIDLKAAPAPAMPENIPAPAGVPSAPVDETAAPKLPAPVPPPPETEKPEAGLLSAFLANPLYLSGALGILLLGGLLWYVRSSGRRRTMADFDQHVLASGDDFKTAIFRTTAGGTTQSQQAATSIMTDFSRLGLGSIDTHEVDPIAEAEVYMAYGRDAQAEEILKEALSKDPSRHEITLKLLEIYAARTDTVTFETQASELYAALGGQASPIWSKAAELGRSIDPGNPLYKQSPDADYPQAPETSAFTSPKDDLSASSVNQAEPETLDTDFDVSSDLDNSQFATIDNLFKDENAAESDAIDLNVQEEKEQEGAIDFDLDIDAFSKDLSSAVVPLTTEEATSGQTLPDTLEESLSDVGLDEISDLGSDTGSTDIEQMVESLSTVEDAATDALPDLDFSGIDLDLKEESDEAPPELDVAPETEELQATPVVPPPGDGDVEVPIDPELWEEVNTKLDLSQAYLEMGDKEGAREILQEILNEGDGSQKTKAAELLSQTE